MVLATMGYEVGEKKRTRTWERDEFQTLIPISSRLSLLSLPV